MNFSTTTTITYTAFFPFSRLAKIEYPIHPEMNVYYEYGAPNTGNQSGRLVKQQDASGVQTFEYGNMGELIKNIHTFVVPGGEAYTFETQWEYDSWNRMKSIQYPDGETVSYSYDNGGKLISMNGNKNNVPYNYINSILYDKFGKRTRIEYGNGTYAEYEYDPLNLRLLKLRSYELGSSLLQDIEYTYDNVGNIQSIYNISGNVYGDLGGDYLYNYVYDDLYRLTEAGGYFDSFKEGMITYALNMGYSPSGNILQKSVDAQTLINGSVESISYNNNYEYPQRPHTVMQVGGFDFEWDNNGNLVWRTMTDGQRTHCWDEENRLIAVRDEKELSEVSAYFYDGGGERVWKLSGPEMWTYLNGVPVYQMANLSKTLYASPLMVMNEQEYTKHYFIEGERVCSKIGGGFKFAPNNPNKDHLEFIEGDAESHGMLLQEFVDLNLYCAGFNGTFQLGPAFEPVCEDDQPEYLQYFYHPDHLGSSSFITDAAGLAEQHIQYLPFGELFVSQRNTSFDSRYKFTAKELDNETNYTYFGARYYDSDLSIWLSVDPLADERSWLSPFNYCKWNH